MRKSGILSALLLMGLCGVLAGAPQIVVTAPAGGENLVLDTSFQIKWTETDLPAGSIVLHLFQGNNQLGAIKFNLSQGIQHFDWVVGKLLNQTVPPGSNYRVRIRLGGSSTWGFSGFFTISEGEEPPPETPPQILQSQATLYNPDLNINLTADRTNPSLGDRLTLWAWIKNVGSGESKSCELQFKLGGSTFSTHEVPALPQNQEIQFSAQKTLNKLGTYYFKAELVNCNDGNRRNNQSQLSVTTGVPDLVFTKIIRSDSNPMIQQKVRVHATVKNIGEAKAGPFSIQMRWERCKGLAQAWPKHRVITGLNPGETTRVTFSYRFPCTRQKVNIMHIDPDNKVFEANEENNVSPRIVIEVHSSKPKYNSKNQSIPIND